MMRRLRTQFGVLVRRILPPLWVRTLRRPVLLPRYYRDLAEDIELVMDLGRHPDLMDDEYWASVLRKHAHILDKGLCVGSFEPGRGRAHREAAAAAYSRIRSASVRNDPSIQWAVAKIEQYDNAQLAQGGCLTWGHLEPAETSYEQLAALVRTRRSIRTYQEQPLKEELVLKIIELAPWASSSCNKQTIKVFATNDPPLAEKCLETCKGGTCFSKYVPCFLSFTADLRSYIMPEEAWLPHIDTSLAAQNCALAATALGLSMTMLSWAQHDATEEATLRTLLDIPQHYRIIVNAAVGYPATAVETPERKSLRNTVVLRASGSG